MLESLVEKKGTLNEATNSGYAWPISLSVHSRVKKFPTQIQIEMEYNHISRAVELPIYLLFHFIHLLPAYHTHTHTLTILF